MLTGQYVRGVRAMLKMSQVELARMVGVSYVVIRNIESSDGICDGKGHILYKIDQIFKEKGVNYDLTHNKLTVTCTIDLNATFGENSKNKLKTAS